MNVQIQLFSFLRECLPANAQGGRAVVDLPTGATIRDLFVELGLHERMHSDILAGKLEDVFEVTVNGVSESNYERRLAEGDQVSCFRRMSGG